MTTAHENLGARGTVYAVLTKADGTKQTFVSKNRISHAGSRYYAQRSCLETPTEFVDTPGDPDLAMVLWTSTTFGTAGNPFTNIDLQDGGTSGTWDAAASYVTGSKLDVDATYPQTDDPDPDNGGAGPLVLTYRVTFGTTDAVSASIRGFALVNQAFSLTTFGAGQIMFSAAWLSGGSAIEKESGATLKVFVNHSINLG